jgi:hypothetical protein
MSYTPTLPLTGVAGWRFLQRTEERQQATFEKSVDVQRDIAYFEEKIGSITSAADLVADRRLLKVALGAFGKDGEIDKKALVRKVLEEGTEADDAFAKRLTDPAWKQLADTFGFGNAGGARTGDAGFAAKIVAAYKTRAFENAVGDANQNLGLAMTFRREITALATAGADGGSWYAVLGSSDLRSVFETALGLPSSFVNVDIDRQRDIFADKVDRIFGSDKLSVFADPENVEKMISRFLARAQIAEGPPSTGPAAAALALLQSSGSGLNGLYNLIASNR